MNMNETVCYCLNVTKREIKEAVQNGATTLEDIQEKTGAGSVCGVCNDQILDLIEFFSKEQNS